MMMMMMIIMMSDEWWWEMTMVMLTDDEDDSNIIYEDSVADVHDNVSITVILIISVHVWDININECHIITTVNSF